MEPGTGRELTLVSYEFHPREKHSNWAVPQAQGDGIENERKTGLPSFFGRRIVLLHPIVAKGMCDGQ